MIKKRLNIIILVLTIFILFSSIAYARPQNTAKESPDCSYCLAGEGSSHLNEPSTYNTQYLSLEGSVSAATPTPEPTEEQEIGVHMNVWDVGTIVIVFLLLMLVFVYLIRL